MNDQVLTVSSSGKLKGLFGAGSSSLSDAETETESAAEASSASEAAPSASASSEAKPEKVDLKDLTTIPLNLTVHFTSIPPMTVEEKRVARRRFGRVFSLCPLN